MLLKNPISNTKRFFQRTLHSFKSIFSNSNDNYHKIPKSPPPPPSMDLVTLPHNNNNNNRGELGSVYLGFSRRRDGRSYMNTANCSTKCRREGKIRSYNNKSGGDDGGEMEEKQWTREEKSWLVAKKLKELEMMYMGDVDHVLDIEEVLHYYSRISCPEYLDIVDKFFMDVYHEFFSSPGLDSRSISRHTVV